MKPVSATFVILAATVIIVSGCKATPEGAQKHMERGAAAAAKKNYKVALIEYKVASQNAPTDPEAIYQIGLVDLQLHDGRGAVDAFEKTLRLKSDHRGATYSYARMKAEAAQPEILEDAAGMLEKILKLQPADTPSLYALAMVEARLSQGEKALNHYQQALDLKAAPIEDVGLAIAITLRRGDLPMAKKFVSLALAKLPQSAEMAVIAAQAARMSGDQATAFAETARALTINPKLTEALQFRIQLAETGGQADAAEAAAKVLASLPAAATRTAFADTLMRHGKTDEALREFRELAAKAPADQQIRQHYIEALYRAHKSEEAKAELESAIKADPKRSDLLVMRARVALEENRTEDAGRDLQVVRQRDFRNEAMILAEARYRELRGETVMQGNLLNEALRLNPGLLEARLNLSRILTQSGKPEVALRILDEASAAERATPVLLRYRNTALIASGAWEVVRTEVSAQLKTQKTPSLELRVQDATVKAHFNDLSGAEREITEVLKASPGNAAALNVMSSVYTNRKQPREYLVWLRKFADDNQGVPSLQIEAARALRATGDLASARRDLGRVTSGNMAEQAGVELAVIDITEGKPDDARNRLLGSIQKRDTAIARVLLAEIYSRGKDWARAEEQLQAAITLSPADPVILINLAAAISKDPKRRDAALIPAQKALALAPGNAVVEGSGGWFYYLSGRYPQAVTHLEASLKASDSAITRYRLAAACVKGGDQACASTQYEAASRMNPSDPMRAEVEPLMRGQAQ